DEVTLASFEERDEHLEEAEAIYKRRQEQAATGSNFLDVMESGQMLASFYERHQRFNEAAAVLQQAAAQLDALRTAQNRNPSIWIGQNLARVLNQVGRTEDADRIYEQLLAKVQDSDLQQVIPSYSNYLAETKRGEKAEKVLQNFLASRPDMTSQQQA